MRIAVMVLLIVAFKAHSGQVFVCTDITGKKSFQDRPCNGAVESEVRKYDTSVPVSSGGYSPSDEQAAYQRLRADNRKTELNMDIKKAGQRVQQYQERMSAELAALQSKKRYAANNQAGATWEQSISTEMQAVTAKYNSLIETERDRMSVMRDEMAGL